MQLVKLLAILASIKVDRCDTQRPVRAPGGPEFQRWRAQWREWDALLLHQWNASRWPLGRAALLEALVGLDNFPEPGRAAQFTC